MPAGLLRWAELTVQPAVDWRRVLAAELRRAVADTAGAVDYSYRRPSRRAPVAGQVVLPALRRPVPEVAVVCDTSGSMTEDLLAAALAEVEGLLRSRAGPAGPRAGPATPPSGRSGGSAPPARSNWSAAAGRTWARGSRLPRPCSRARP